MNKLILVIILVIAVAAVAFFVVSSKEAQAPGDVSTLEGLLDDADQVQESDESSDVSTEDTDEGGTSAGTPSFKTHQIALGSEGHEPRNLTIQQGDTIVFSTTENKPFWPASNVHPTHRIYSVFDPKSPVSPDDTWSFTFDQVGEWGYHDHLAPFHSGVITVTPR